MHDHSFLAGVAFGSLIALAANLLAGAAWGGPVGVLIVVAVLLVIKTAGEGT